MSIASKRVHRTPRSADVGTYRTHVTSLSSSVARADTSRQIDPDYTLGAMGSTAPLDPPYPLHTLSTIFGQSNMLAQCVESYVTNIAMYGWEIVAAAEGVPIDKDEQMLLQTFIDSPNSDESLRTIQASTVFAYEKFGHAYVEVIRDRKRRVTILRSCPSATMGVCPKADEDVPVHYDVARGPRIVQVTEIKKFRIYRQQQGGKFVYFKEFGDPRKLNYKTGIFESPQNPVTLEDEATELIHFRQMSEDVYGTPRWVSQLPSILGSREAEEVNLRYFEDNTIPPMILSVAGGRLTGESFRELKKMLSARAAAKERQNQIMLIEAVPERESLDDKGTTVTLKVDKLTDSRPSDALFTNYDESNQAKIRSSFRLPPVSVGLSQDITFACMSEDTETLTERGWLPYWCVGAGDKIATINPATMGLEFHEPIGGIYLYDYEGPMHRYVNRNCDILVTPNHRMWWAPSQGYKVLDFRITRADEIPTRNVSFMSAPETFTGGLTIDEFRVPHIGRNGGFDNTVQGTRLIAGDAFVELVGLVLGDGCISVVDKRYNIRLAAKKPRKLELFDRAWQACMDAGLCGSVCDLASTTRQYTISDRGLAQWFVTNCGRVACDKRVPDELMRLSARQSSILLDALLATDGHWQAPRGAGSTRNSWNFCSTSKTLADQVQILGHKCGYRASVKQTTPTSWQVRLVPGKSTHCVKPEQMLTEPYKGKVYCFEVPNHLFVTRRNGKVAIQGNTANVSTFVAETQVFGPERTKYDEVWNKKFVQHPSGLNLKSVALRSRAPIVTNPEILIRSLTALNVMGAVTPRLARIAANDILQINLDPYPEKDQDGYESWMDEPIIFATKTNSGNEGIDPAGAGNTHEGQQGKDDKLKELEKEGDPSPQNPEHGQE